MLRQKIKNSELKMALIGKGSPGKSTLKNKFIRKQHTSVSQSREITRNFNNPKDKSQPVIIYEACGKEESLESITSVTCGANIIFIVLSSDSPTPLDDLTFFSELHLKPDLDSDPIIKVLVNKTDMTPGYSNEQRKELENYCHFKKWPVHYLSAKNDITKVNDVFQSAIDQANLEHPHSLLDNIKSILSEYLKHAGLFSHHKKRVNALINALEKNGDDKMAADLIQNQLDLFEKRNQVLPSSLMHIDLRWTQELLTSKRKDYYSVLLKAKRVLEEYRDTQDYPIIPNSSPSLVK